MNHASFFVGEGDARKSCGSFMVKNNFRHMIVRIDNLSDRMVLTLYELRVSAY